MILTRRDAVAALSALSCATACPALGRSSSAENRPSAPTDSEMKELDALLQNFKSSFDYPGLSVAMAFEGKVLFEKATGDAVVAADGRPAIPLRTNDLFRIASLSKQFTSVTVLDLITHPVPGAPRLSLADKVFGDRGILRSDFAGVPICDARFREISVEQLLTHTSGCPSNQLFTIEKLPGDHIACKGDASRREPGGYRATDPMFASIWRGKTRHELIASVLANMRLEFDPGTKYNYSNFGFLLLGRIIERCVTPEGRNDRRTTYAEVVRERILDKIGIHDMRIAENALKNRREHEVEYYGPPDDNPYAIDVTRMDSHGGWLATASDVARFAWAGVNMLDPRMRHAMVNVPKVPQEMGGQPSNYGMGWVVNAGGCNIYHNGSLPGTQTYVVRSATGFSWGILTNFRSPKNASGTEMDSLGWKMIGKVASWRAQNDAAPSNTMCMEPSRT